MAYPQRLVLIDLHADRTPDRRWSWEVIDSIQTMGDGVAMTYTEACDLAHLFLQGDVDRMVVTRYCHTFRALAWLHHHERDPAENAVVWCT